MSAERASDIVQFIAKRTGLSPELVDRVVTAGEPWPGAIAIQQYFHSRDKTLDAALADPDDTLPGLEAVEVDAEVLARHQRYVATSLKIREEDVSSIGDSMQEYFRAQIKDLKNAKRRLARRRR